jgi:hypothetical protein
MMVCIIPQCKKIDGFTEVDVLSIIGADPSSCHKYFLFIQLGFECDFDDIAEVSFKDNCSGYYVYHDGEVGVSEVNEMEFLVLFKFMS